MARIPYPTDETLASEPLVERIVTERGSLLNLYRMLLHSAPLAEGWLSFFTAIRQKCSLPGKIREMVIMRIASIHNATYEFSAHEPFALQEGITPEQINSLSQGSKVGFDDFEKAILAYCEAMTQDVEIPDTIFEEVKTHFNEREFIELTATIAGYNLVSRFLEAIQIDHEPTIAES